MIRSYQPTDVQYFKHRPPYGTTAMTLCTPDPVGWIAYDTVPGFSQYADAAIYVSPEVRRKGHGTTLLNWLYENLPEQYERLSFSYLSGDEQSPQFFTAHQYKIDHVEEIFQYTPSDTAEEEIDPAELTIHSPYEKADLLRSIYDQSFAPHAWYQPFENNKEVVGWLQNGKIGLYSIDGEAVGMAGIRPIVGALEIEPFGILPTAQGQGNGRKFLQQLCQHLSNYEQPIQLTVWKQNQPAIHLYKSLGFEWINGRFYVAKPL